MHFLLTGPHRPMGYNIFILFFQSEIFQTIIFIAISLIILIIVQRLILWQSLKRITYHASVSHSIVEPGQIFTITSEISNHKVIPELFMELKEPIPWGAEIIGKYKTSGNDRRYLHKRFYIMGKQSILSKTDMRVHERGPYNMHDAVMSGGDFFGFSSRSKTFPYVRRVICIPEKMQVQALSKVLGSFLGDVSVRRFILPDPILTIGARDYTGREPIKDIHHAQSARQGKLMVRQYDHTLELAVTVVLNIALASHPPRYEKVEKCLSLARAVFEELSRLGVKFGFITNAKSSYNEHWQNAGDGFGQGHLNMLLCGLGCASIQTNESYDELLKRTAHTCESGRSHIIITPEADNHVAASLRRLQEQSGGSLLILKADDYMALEKPSMHRPALKKAVA